MSSISLKGVSYTYRGKYQTVRAVNNVSYDFEPGKCYAIIGKSGSGKTTLLSLMAGLDLPSEGEIIVDGKSTKDWNRNRMRREAVSVIYQNYNLFPLLTVKENILYPLDLIGVPRKRASALAREVRERVELSEKYDTLRVVCDQIGTPTYTLDLSRLLIDMVETEKYGYYHATNEGGYISWHDFACEIFRQAGKTMTVNPVTTAEYGVSKAARPFNSRLDKSKLTENGFAPLPTWQDALARYLKEIEA